MQDKQYRERQRNDQDFDRNIQLATTEQQVEVNVEDYYKQTGKLPPRHLTHRKKQKGKSVDQALDKELVEDEEEQEDKQPKRRRGFPMIQIMFYAFLAFIIAFYLIWFYQERQQETVSPPVNDPFQNFINQGNQQQQEPPQTEAKDEAITQDGDTEGQQGQDGQAEEDSSPLEVAKPTEENALEPKDEENEHKLFSSEILTEHVIKPNETFYSITVHYYGSADYMDALAAYNGIDNIRDIRSGTMLIIPKKASP